MDDSTTRKLAMTRFLKPALTVAMLQGAMPFWAQSGVDSSSPSADSSKVYDIVEQVPIWGSCSELIGKEAEACTYEQLAKHVVAETKYPKKARKMGLSGKVFVEFVIDTDGSVIDVSILRGVHPLLDDEAIRVVKSFPEFIPGQQRGKPVKVRYRLPMNFALD